MSYFRVASVSMLFASACGAVETTDVEQHIPVLPPGGCEEFGCGGNSPEVDNLGLHDFYGVVGSGIRNANGFTVDAIEKAGVSYDKIYAVNGNIEVKGPALLTGAFVAGTHFWVSEPGGNVYELWITEVGRTPMWAHITGWEQATTYKMVWDVKATMVGQKRNWRNVCTNPPPQGSPDVQGMDRFSTVVFELDEINATKKTVSQRKPDPTILGYDEHNWLNIGCAGHALAKLHLTGNTTAAGGAFGFHVDNSLKTAALKMFAADYCGTGYPWTVAGQKLQWLDDGGGSGTPYNVYMPGFAGKKEALWTEKGAKCLNYPRVLANPTALGSSIFATNIADFQADIKAICGFLPPKCTDLDPYSYGGAHLISGNP